MAIDGHIHVLPLHVANKIAAGEVVERPASVAKELVENAIDAGAKSIKITISQGGRKLVAVQDDGCGMSRDDAILSLERQATSKILDVGDIDNIETLGFRGEAVPSIASVSRFLLTTRRHDEEEGTRIEVNAGTLADVRSAGCPPGTLVEVRDLFCNVPARLKFLRSYATEEAHVRNIYTVNALAHPGIAFSLVVDSREVGRLAAAKSPEMRIRELFGNDFADSLLRVNYEGENVSVSGFVERPNRAFPSRRPDYIFINGRPATAPAIQSALRDAYPRRAGDAKPAAILFISLPPKDVDVNVHPAKREVRFRRGTEVRDAILAACAPLRGAIQDEMSAIQVQSWAPPPPQPPPQPQHVTPPPAQHVIPSPAPARVPPPVQPPAPTPPPVQLSAPVFTAPPPPPPAPAPTYAPPPASPTLAPPPAQTPPRSFLAKASILAITSSGYILLETDSGIVTVNPHAARERIAFERLLSRASEVPSQQLLVPEMVQLPPADFLRLREALDILSSMGWRIEEFGQGVFKVDAVPQILDNTPAATVLATIAQDLASAGAARGGAKWREDLIVKSIAASWAGAGNILDLNGAKSLIEELAACRLPYVCPRGKNTMIFTSTRELDRKFGRV